MAKGSSKKPGDPKCRGCGALLEGRQVVRIGGNRWHQECAEKSDKYIAREYREPREKPAPAAPAEPVVETPAEPATEVSDEGEATTATAE